MSVSVLLFTLNKQGLGITYVRHGHFSQRQQVTGLGLEQDQSSVSIWCTYIYIYIVLHLIHMVRLHSLHSSCTPLWDSYCDWQKHRKRAECHTEFGVEVHRCAGETHQAWQSTWRGRSWDAQTGALQYQAAWSFPQTVNGEREERPTVNCDLVNKVNKA